jgi:hypothetical protein
MLRRRTVDGASTNDRLWADYVVDVSAAAVVREGSRLRLVKMGPIWESITGTKGMTNGSRNPVLCRR